MKLPSRVSNSILKKHFRPGEPTVVVKACGFGSHIAYEFRDRSPRARTYIMSRDAKRNGHVLYVPLWLWMDKGAQFAHDMMENNAKYPLVVTFEIPQAAPQAAPEPPKPRSPVLPDEPEEGELPPALKPESEPEPQEDVADIDPETLRLSIAEYVKEAPIRIRALAQQLGVTADQIKAALEDPSATAMIVNPGWVKIKTAE